MDLKLINQKAHSLMSERKAHLEREPGGIYHHGQRTASLAVELRKIIIPDDYSHDDILTVIGWFHDCAKGIEPHPKYGAAIAREALQELVTDNELQQICSVISVHDMRKPDSEDYDVYTKLIQDADLLDHFGIYEIWMNIQYWSHTSGSIEDMIEYYNENHKNHVNRHRKLLNFEASKKIYDDRVEFESLYISRLMDEGTGKIHNKEGLR